MRWQTVVDLAQTNSKILYKDKITLLGSCFANEIGSKLLELRFMAELNPFGTLFNPASIALSLRRLIDKTPFTQEEIFCDRGVWKSFYHSSAFASMSAEEFLIENNRRLAKAASHFEESKFVILTFGTSWIYRAVESGEIVSNCHKLPSSNFNREFLEHDSSYTLLAPIIERYPNKEWIITVSPVRHFKEGAHGNQISKAHLLILSNKLEQNYKNVSYFPSYEIFMDELRDYRFYASDMVHPSSDSINYIWDRFRESAISHDCDTLIDLVSKVNALKGHRPFFLESEDYKQMVIKVDKLEQKIQEILQREG